jgi:hypothetical protein
MWKAPAQGATPESRGQRTGGVLHPTAAEQWCSCAGEPQLDHTIAVNAVGREPASASSQCGSGQDYGDVATGSGLAVSG